MGFHVFSGCLSLSSKGAADLKKINSPLLKVLHVDVTKSDHIEEAFNTVKETLDQEDKKLWAVVNNAGISGVFSEIEWIPPELYQKVLEVNTVGVIRVTKTFLPLLRQSQGRVVIVASLAGRYVFPGGAPYSISKHAVLCYADCLRREMKKWDISVHTIEPSFYRTPLMDTLKEAAEQMWEKVPKDIHDSYGDEYFKDFEGFIGKAIHNAKPASQIYEVTDDILDAIAGIEPRIRYVPSVTTYIRSQVISSLPSEAQDFVLCKMVAPKTPPADIAKRPRKLPLRRTYSEILKDKIGLTRTLSMPVVRRTTPSPTPTPKKDDKFKFEDVSNLSSK